MSTSETFSSDAEDRGPLSDVIRRVFLLAVIAAAISPMLIYPLGITGDYPNHLARVYIEHRLADSAALQEHFTLDWGIYPDLAMDMFVRPLMAVFDPIAAGAVFNAVAVALLPIGVALISLALTGRVGLPVAASVLLIYNKALAWGFINFAFTLGLALCCFALWIWVRPGWRRTGIFAALMPILFFSHVLGFLLFGFLLLAYEVGQYLAGERGPFARFAASLLRDGLIAVVPIALFGWSLSARLSQLETEINEFGGVVSRRDAILAPFDFETSLSAPVLFFGFYAVLFVAFRYGWLRLAPPMWPVFWASVVLVFVVPAGFSGISLLHIRYGAIPAAILLAGATLTPEGSARLRLLAVSLVGLLVLQHVFVHKKMAFLDDAQQKVREVVATLPTGTRLLVGADAFTMLVYRLNHTPAFVVIEADGYVPNLFTNTSPVGVTSRALPLHRPQAWPLSEDELAEAAYRDPPQAAPGRWSEESYLNGWPTTFDAVLWYGAPGGQNPNPEHLTQIAETAFFRLYEITPGSGR